MTSDTTSETTRIDLLDQRVTTLEAESREAVGLAALAQSLRASMDALGARVAELVRQRQREEDTAADRAKVRALERRELLRTISEARAAGENAAEAAAECRSIHDGAAEERRRNTTRLDRLEDRLSAWAKVAVVLFLPLYGALAKAFVGWLLTLGGAS